MTDFSEQTAYRVLRALANHPDNASVTVLAGDLRALLAEHDELVAAEADLDFARKAESEAYDEGVADGEANLRPELEKLRERCDELETDLEEARAAVEIFT